MTPEVKEALRETVNNFILWTDNTPHSNEPTELGVYFGQLDEGEVVDRLADELAVALQPEIERLVIEEKAKELERWAAFFTDPSMNAMTPSERLYRRANELWDKLYQQNQEENKS